MTIIWSLLMFLVFITIHEFGHFYAAKKSNIKVEEFAVGMGPKLFSKQKGETLYSIRAIPIGGFCALEGEDEISEDPRSFNNAPAKNRFWTIIAGALNNFIFGFILCILLAATMISTPKISSIVPNSPAESIGLKEGDEIIEINHQKITSIEDVQIITQESEGNEMSLKYKNHKDELISTSIKPERSSDSGLYLLGFSFSQDYSLKAFSLRNGILNGPKMFLGLIVTLYKIIGMLFTGKLGLKGLAGPVGVINQIGEASKFGLANVVFLLAYININLGVVNLLPIPALDGGRAVFILIEWITGKKVSTDTEGKIHFVGLILLLCLIAYVTLQDIIRLF